MKRLAVSFSLIAVMSVLSAVSCKRAEYITGPIYLEPSVGYDFRSEATAVEQFPANETFSLWAWNEKNNSPFINGEVVAQKEGKWRCIEDWPIHDELRFEGVATRGKELPVTRTSGRGLQLKGFASPESGTDLLYAPLTRLYSRGDGAPAVLQFDHALTKIDFRAENGMPTDVMMRVDKVTLKNVCPSGDFDTSTGKIVWTAGGQAQDYSFLDKPASLTFEPEFIGDYKLFIPQDSQLVIEVEFSFSIDEGQVWIENQVSATEPFKAGWLPGNYKTYTLTITQDKLAVTEGISNWNNRL